MDHAFDIDLAVACDDLRFIQALFATKLFSKNIESICNPSVHHSDSKSGIAVQDRNKVNSPQKLG